MNANKLENKNILNKENPSKMEISSLTYKIPGKLVASICELNQWALDFEGNYQRICESIRISIAKGATYRLGPELEVTGYNCMDHFNEIDTTIHAYEILARILANEEFYGIVLDIGMPVMNDGVRYNSRAICFNGELLCIRPKTVLANDGMYHEERWFVGWKKTVMAEWIVPEIIASVIGKMTVPIGVCVLQFIDVSIGIESCEELFVPNSLHNAMAMNGAHVICNGSGSHFQIGKVNKRFDLVANASGKTGCTYLYGNLQGCDGSTMYFDGGSFVASYGKIVSMNQRFTINTGVTVLIAIIDINEIRSRRAVVVSLCKASAESPMIPKIYIPHKICKDFVHHYDDMGYLDPYDVISRNNKEIDDLIGPPSCYLWDYLKRSGCSGFFIPLSGGADSSTVAILVYHMCEKVVSALHSASSSDLIKLKAELYKITNDTDFIPNSAKELCNRILFTSYMKSSNSSVETAQRAQKLANFLNCCHIPVDIESVCKQLVETVSRPLNINPKFLVDGGSKIEDLALQNVQARSRLVISYLFSQLAPLTRPISHNSSFLVLGTSNADEIVRGYFTKYDCSSGDISPIASLSKEHIIKILKYFGSKYDLEVLFTIAEAKPSAELVPLLGGKIIQEDETDMGFTYTELTRMREIRSHLFCGPLSMFNILLDEWGKIYQFPNKTAGMPLEVIADKVKRFFMYYAINRHKTTILPPSIHMSDTSIDGRHYDMRPFLINCLWTWQFNCIDRWLKEKTQT